MRIYDREKKRPVTQLDLFITNEDAKRILDALVELESLPPGSALTVFGQGKNGVLDKELKIAVYQHSNLEMFDEEIKRLITNGPDN